MTLIPAKAPEGPDPLLSKFQELLTGRSKKESAKEFAISKKRANGIQEAPVGFWKNTTGFLHVLILRIRFLFSNNKEFFDEIANQLSTEKLSPQDLKWFRNKTIVELKNTIKLDDEQLQSAVSSTGSALTKIAIAYLGEKSAVQPPKPKTQILEDGGSKVAKREPIKSQKTKLEQERHIDGFTFYDMPADNNCFYHTLAFCTAKEGEMPLQQDEMRVEVQRAVDEILKRKDSNVQKRILKEMLRSSIDEHNKAKELENEREGLSSLASGIPVDKSELIATDDPEQAIITYCDRITENLFWGGLAELYAYCVVHNIQASVFDGKTHIAQDIFAWAHYNPKIKSKNQIFLDYEGGDHYNAYIKID